MQDDENQVLRKDEKAKGELKDKIEVQDIAMVKELLENPEKPSSVIPSAKQSNNLLNGKTQEDNGKKRKEASSNQVINPPSQSDNKNVPLKYNVIEIINEPIVPNFVIENKQSTKGNKNPISKESSRENLHKPQPSDRLSSRKPSISNIKAEILSPNGVLSVENSPKKIKEDHLFFPLDMGSNTKGIFNSKNRLLSSKVRKSVDKRSDFRPNTASMNRNLVNHNLGTRSEDFFCGNGNSSGDIMKNKPSRPLTAAVKDNQKEKNIINININFYKIDLNQKYFDPTSTKNLLYINENVFKTENDRPKIINEDDQRRDILSTILKGSRVGSARMPQIKVSEPIKVTELMSNRLEKRTTNEEVAFQQKTSPKDNNFRTGIFKQKSSRATSTNDFIFKSILSTIETTKEKRKLTINDFK